MIEYFKYTNGDSFTLSGVDYTGLFNVVEGKAFTGKSFSSSSKLLSAKNTFLANCFINEFEFDRTTTPINRNILKQPQISPRNVLDQNFIDTNLQILNLNNLKLFSQNIIANPDLFDFVNSVEGGDSYFLGLSSGKEDIRNDDTKLAKTNSFPIQIDPFSFIDKVPGVDVLDETKDSIIFVYDDESYYYFTTTSTSSYTFSGSFVNGGSLIRIEDDVFEGAQRFSYDNNTDTLYALENTGTSFVLKLYDNSFVAPCRVLKLVDQITLNDNIIDDKISLGSEVLGYRYTDEEVEVVDEEVVDDEVEVNNGGRTHGKRRIVPGVWFAPNGEPFPRRWGPPPDGMYTRDFVDFPEPYGQGSGTLRAWIQLNIANDENNNITSDDNVSVIIEDNIPIIKVKILNKYTYEFINNIVSSNPNEAILDFDIRDSDDSILILTSLEGYESEEFYIYHLDIDKVSSKEGDYVLPFNPKVLRRYKPQVEYKVRPGEVSIYFSGNDSNIFTIDDEGAISTRFITNPENVAGFPSIENLLYLEDMYFDSTLEQFDSIEKKFNSNTLPSNNYNNLNFLVTKNSTDLFYVLHNIGRIYLLKESKLLYKNFVPLTLKNLYEQITSCESSLGISINSELQNIIKDTSKVFLNASVIPYKEFREGIPVLGKFISYEGIDINFRNLEFHENEEVNYDTVSRVFDQIYKLQETVFNIIVSGEDEDDKIGSGPDVVENVTEFGNEVQDNLYTAGGQYILRDTGEEYVGFFHIHPEKGAMEGPLHVDTPHRYLDTFDGGKVYEAYGGDIFLNPNDFLQADPGLNPPTRRLQNQGPNYMPGSSQMRSTFGPDNTGSTGGSY